MSNSYEQHRPVQMNLTQMTLIDPYVIQTLQSVMGREVVIETVRGSIRGVICDVKPDHVVLQASDSYFFVRIQQVIWVMPTA